WACVASDLHRFGKERFRYGESKQECRHGFTAIAAVLSGSRPAATPARLSGGCDMSERQITGVILAGGRARRMGGRDKGLLPLAGRPMVEYVLEALRPQVDAVLISANRHQAEYGRYGHPVVTDDTDDYPGPLAGMAAG